MTPQYDAAISDAIAGLCNWKMWGRLGWQEIKRRYRRTTFGPFWTTLSLGVFICTLGILWSHLWKQNPQIFLPYLTSGMLAWSLLSTIITEGCTVFTGNESLIKSMKFNFTILTCSVVWRNVVVFLHNTIIFVLVALYAHVPLNWNTLLLPVGLLLVALNGVWIVTIFGVLCTRYRDIAQLVGSLLQVVMFCTPIFWNADQLGARLVKFVDFNIFFHFVDIIRAPMLGKAPATWSYVMVTGTTVLGWLAAMMLFSRFRRRIPYWL